MDWRNIVMKPDFNYNDQRTVDQFISAEVLRAELKSVVVMGIASEVGGYANIVPSANAKKYLEKKAKDLGQVAAKSIKLETNKMVMDALFK